MTFEDKTVWITGASSGIGASLARELSRHGARLAMHKGHVHDGQQGV